MSLRQRVGVASAAVVALVVALALLTSYLAVRDELIGQIDKELRSQAALIVDRFHGDEPLPGMSASAGGSAPYFQSVFPNGTVTLGPLRLPQVRQAQAVASGTASAYLTSVYAGHAPLRMYTFEVNGIYYDGQTAVAIQLARPLTEVDNALRRLKLLLALVFFAGVALAALLGRMAARRVLSPLAEVTATAQLIGETDDLSQRLSVRADDEVGQLAENFNAMLERLAASRGELDDSMRAQRQLVADASHELRTPITSLRTNIEVLLAGGELGEEDRRRLLSDVVEQTEELSTLVSDLIEVARGDLPSESLADTRLDGVAEESLARARRNSPEVEFVGKLQPVVVRGNGERLARAINNLLDNAVLHSGGGTIELSVDATGVIVRDHGPGISEEDLPHVFDRFYRGASSRATQGSGLGLAIVRQVAELHGGSVSAANAPDGGAVVTLKLPTTQV
jgi:two-component system, OmpR family, sensor histidine kinase MprB